MNKKKITLIVLIILAFTLTGCTSNKEKDSKNNKEVKELDLNKCKNSNKKYSNPNPEDKNNIGISVNLLEDGGAKLVIDWSKFGGASGATGYVNEIVEHEIRGFDKKVEVGFVGGNRDDVTQTIIFYLMEDGSVEYTRLFIEKESEKKIKYYQINYSYDYDNNGSVKGTSYFKTQGKILEGKKFTKLYNVTCDDRETTIGVLENGSFYDLGKIILEGK